MIPINKAGGGGGGKIDVTVSEIPNSGEWDTYLPRLTYVGTGLSRIIADGMGRLLLFSEKTDDPRVERITTVGDVEYVSPLSVARATYTLGILGDGRVLCIGGAVAGGQTYAVDCFNLDGSRTSFPNTTALTVYGTAATDGNGNVVFVGYHTTNGGVTVDRFNIDGTKTQLPNLSGSPMVGTNTVTLSDGSVLVVCGAIASTSAPRATIERYMLDGTKTAFTPSSVARSYPAAATDGLGRVLVFGGYTGTSSATATTSVDRFDASGVRTALPNMTEARAYAYAATDADGNVYVGGGRLATGGFSQTVDKYSLDGVKTTVATLSLPANSRAIGAERLHDGSVVFVYWAYNASATSTELIALRFGVNKRDIKVPAFHAYKFGIHDAEQPAQPMDTIVTVKSPDSGYFKAKKGAISL